MNKVEAIVLHHTASSRDRTTFEQVNEWHKVRWPNFKSSLGWYIGYQYLIMGNGDVLQARKATEEGAHTLGGWNRKSVGIALTGDFRYESPSKAQLEALESLLIRVRSRWGLGKDQVYSHREKQDTKCPGQFDKWIIEYRSNIAKLKAKVILLVKIITLIKQLVWLKNLLRKKQ